MAANGGGGSVHSDPHFSGLDPQVLHKLDEIFSQGTCAPRDIDDKVVQQLRVLPPSDAIDALAKLESAVSSSSVRNTSAYLAGVIRRLTRLPVGPGMPEGAALEGDGLAPPAAAILEQLYAAGLVRRGELDSKSLRSLASKPAEVQVAVIDTFRDRNLHGIRNMAAFFTSHQMQVERDLREGRLQLPALRGGPGAGPPQGQQPQYPGQQQYQGQQPQYQGQGAPPAYGRYEPPLAAPPGPAYAGAPPAQVYQPPYTQHGAPQQAAQYAPPQLQQLQQLPPQQLQQQPYATAPQQPAYAAQATAPQAAAPPKHYALEQVEWGVRVDEFQGLSPLAKFVHPAAALRLQQLWDVDQNKLVSVMNEASWEALAGLDAQSSVAAVNEAAEAIKAAPDDLATANSIFQRIAARFPKRADAPSLAAVSSVVAAAQALLPALAAPTPPQQAPAPQQQAPYGGAPPAQPIAAQPVAYGAPPPYQQQAPPVYGGPLSVGGVAPEYGPRGGAPPYDQGRYAAPAPAAAPVRLPGPAGALPQSVQACIDRILQQWGGQLQLEHFDLKCVDMMQRMGERNALLALDEFGRNNPQQMRNVTAYLIGCLRKYADDAGEYGGGRGGGADRHGGTFGERGGVDRFEGGRGRGRAPRGRGRGGRGETRDGDWEPKRYAPY